MSSTGLFVNVNMYGKYHGKHFFDPMRKIRFLLYNGVVFAWDPYRDVWVVYSENLTNQVRFNGFGNGKARI